MHTLYGDIKIEEVCFMKNGHLFRPFSVSAKVYCKCYSFYLQKIIIDFGADLSFEEASKKIKYHYRIDVQANTIRKITEQHAKKVFTTSKKPSIKSSKKIIAEVDGSMVPIVNIDSNSKGDKRKNKKTFWKEAKLCFAKEFGRIDKHYACVIGSPEEAGKKLYECVLQSGLGDNTKIHGLGDGALWIADQMEDKFGPQVNFLIDFYHLCEYLSEASVWADVLNSKKWFSKQKEKLKAGKAKEVLEEIKIKIDKFKNLKKDNALVKCYFYMKKRMKYFDYKSALEQGLPIGSGEIESAHRYVIQQRLKIPGAWWKKENAIAMINLRIARLNGVLEDYWEEEMKKKRAA